MRAKTGSRIVLLALLAVVISGRRAEAQVSDEATCGTSLPACSALRLNCCTRDFASTATDKAILIPLDRCHQPFTNAAGTGADVGDTAPQWCSGSPSPQVNAQNYAYGLIYRLMQNKIPIYWIVNPTKAPSTNGITATSVAAQTKDVDFWILTSSGVTPGPAASLTGTGTHVKRLAPTSVGTASLAYGAGTNYVRDQFPIRGGAFLIAPEDRTAFDNFMKSSLGRSTCGSGSDCYNFISPNGVFLYEIQPGAKFVWQDYTQPLVASKYVENAGSLPVALRIDYAPPKVAIIPGTTMLSAVLQSANLDDIETTASCKGGTFTVSNAIGCQLTEADVTTSNRLVTTSFDNAWIDLNPATCSTFIAKVQAFATSTFGVTNGGNVIMFGDSISAAEQCTGVQGALLGRDGTGLAIYGSSVNDSNSNPYIVRYANNLLSQYGDLPINFASGSVKAWDRVTSTTDLYDALYVTTATTSNTLRRLLTQEVGGTLCSNHRDTGVTGAASAAGCDSTANNTSPGDYRDAFAYGRYLNNKRNGLIFYSPGQNPNTNPTKSHMKLLLGTLIAVPPFLVDQVFTNIEVTRSSPVVASIGGTPSIVQGSYEYHYKTDAVGTQFPVPRTLPTVFTPEDVATWSFPAILGHLRGVATSSVDITPLDLSGGTATLDVASGEGTGSTDTFPSVVYSACAKPYTGACRAIWTATGNGASMTFQSVVEGNTAVSTLMLPETSFAAVDTFTGRTYRENFVRKILKGYDDGTGYVPRLGGIDRSTAAVIGPGESVGVNRATIIYVGAMDGMVHAICAEAAAAFGCPRKGMELWAFIPKVNLPQLRYNQARVDASPRILDVRLPTVGGKTVLLVQAGLVAGTAGQTPAIYALDITDPQNPNILWEYATWDPASTVALTTPTSRPTNGLGVGLSLAAGQAIFTTPTTSTKNIVLAQTNNGGTGNNGSYVIAIDIATGQKLWDKFYAYPSSTVSTGLFGRSAVPATDIPSSAIPAGVVPVDKTLAGTNGFMTDLVVGDLYGNLWLLNPENGTSRVLSATSVEIPLFQYTTDFHPIAKPAIYNEGGILYAAFVTGGYHDYTTAALWGAGSGTQYLTAVNLNSTSVTAPLNETSAAADVPVKETITGFGYAQVRVVDQEIFAASDTTNINLATFGTASSDTGRIAAYNIATNAAIANIATTRAGASSVINNGTDLYVSSGNKRQHLATTAAAQLDSSGVAGERTTLPNQVTTILKKLWLRTE